MFKVVPFKAEHVAAMAKQKINSDYFAYFTNENFLKWVEKTNSVTGMWNDSPMVCGGITHKWPGSGHLWTMFDEASKECFVPIFRGIKDWISSQMTGELKRLEVSIPCEFRTGCRRAEMLGFRLECGWAESYLPDGKDAAVYVMTKRGA